MAYDFTEHAHRYACWTAARAASSGWYKNEEISGYFSQIRLREAVQLLTEKKDLEATYYRAWFVTKVAELQKVLPAETAKGKKRKPSSFFPCWCSISKTFPQSRRIWCLPKRH